MSGLKEFVEKRLLELGESPFSLARRYGAERGFINDILIGKKRSVRGDKMHLLAAMLQTSAEEIARAESPKNWGRRLREMREQQSPSEASVSAESSIDDDLGRRKQKNSILEIDVRAGAGGGGYPVDAWVHDGNGNTYGADGVRDQWHLPQSIMREGLRAAPNHIRIFEVIGDSMTPLLHEGDRAFVDTRYKEPVPDGIFALWDGYGLVIKMLQVIRGSDPLKVKILSKNDSYPPYEATLDEIKIVGRLSGKFTTSVW
jgi:phage repressor protein C with HTH and peptisase S24 domain